MNKENDVTSFLLLRSIHLERVKNSEWILLRKELIAEEIIKKPLIWIFYEELKIILWLKC